MSRFTAAMLAFSAGVALVSAQLLSGPPGDMPQPPPARMPSQTRLASPAVPPPTARPATVVAPAAAPVTPAAPAAPNALTFDAETKDYAAKVGEEHANFTFIASNSSASDVSINSLRTSCGCTVAQLPTQPYTLKPGSNVPINVTMDLRGKMGVVTKSVSVDSSAGFKSLLVRVTIPQPNSPGAQPANGALAIAASQMDRAKNIQASLSDRQAVFKGNCTECHVQKGIGKLGKELYEADCGVCHDAEHRAAMVPDLKVPRTSRDLAFWKQWIEEGKAGTMMPAFAAAHGGPLTKEQIDSLINYAYQTFPKEPPVTPVKQQAQAPLPPAPPAAPVRN